MTAGSAARAEYPFRMLNVLIGIETTHVPIGGSRVRLSSAAFTVRGVSVGRCRSSILGTADLTVTSRW
jgi:hypothetical protein